MKSIVALINSHGALGRADQSLYREGKLIKHYILKAFANSHSTSRNAKYQQKITLHQNIYEIN